MPQSPYTATVYPPIQDLDEYRRDLRQSRARLEYGEIDRQENEELLEIGENLLEQCDFLSTKLSIKKTQYETMKKELDALKKDVSTRQTEIETLKQQSKAERQDIETLKTQNQVQQEEIETLKKEKAMLNGQDDAQRGSDAPKTRNADKKRKFAES